MKRSFAKITFNDQLDWMLNIRIRRGVDDDGHRFVELDHSMAIDKLAVQAKVTNSCSIDTPMDHAIKLEEAEEAVDGTGEGGPGFEYASVLGGVMYIANLTRPDICAATNKLTRYLKKPGRAHYKALIRLVKYMYHTKNRFLRYTHQNPKDPSNNPFRLNTAADASYGDEGKRSTIGWCTWFGNQPNGLLTWSSKLTKTVAMSTTEAEVQAAAECARDIVYHRAFLYECGYPQQGSTRIHEDNNACISQMHAIKGVRAARQYVVQLGKLQELVAFGVIHAHPVDSKKNVADLFTKPLPGIPFWKLSTWAVGDQKSPTCRDVRELHRFADASGGSVKRAKSALNVKGKKARTATGEEPSVPGELSESPNPADEAAEIAAKLNAGKQKAAATKEGTLKAVVQLIEVLIKKLA